MSTAGSLLDELRTQYEAARQSTHEHADVEGFQEFDARRSRASTARFLPGRDRVSR
jgi:hypothetical protein